MMTDPFQAVREALRQKWMGYEVRYDEALAALDRLITALREAEERYPRAMNGQLELQARAERAERMFEEEVETSRTLMAERDRLQGLLDLNARLRDEDLAREARLLHHLRLADEELKDPAWDLHTFSVVAHHVRAALSPKKQETPERCPAAYPDKCSGEDYTSPCWHTKAPPENQETPERCPNCAGAADALPSIVKCTDPWHQETDR